MGVLGPGMGEGWELYSSFVGADTKKLPTVCAALGKSQKLPRSEVKGTSEAQRREGTRMHSFSEGWQSQAASPGTEAIPDLSPISAVECSCHSPSSTQWPQLGIFLGHAFALGAHIGVWRAGALPDAASCPDLGGVVGTAAPETPGCQAWLGLDWFSNCNPLPGKDTVAPCLDLTVPGGPA